MMQNSGINCKRFLDAFEHPPGAQPKAFSLLSAGLYKVLQKILDTSQ
jgi:hypothetical protein